MKRPLFLFLLITIRFVVNAEDGIAGPDQMASLEQPAIIGPLPDPAYCYTWSSSKENDKAIAGKTHDAQLIIVPDKTTTYTLTRQLKGKTGADAKPETGKVTVYRFSIEYFQYPNKEWKVVVGKLIEYNALAIPGCTDWEWKLGDKWSLILENQDEKEKQQGRDVKIPYPDLAKALQANVMWFGDAFGNVTVSCKDPQGKMHIVSSPVNVQVFYDPFQNINGGSPDNFHPPCWFLFGQHYGLIEGFNDQNIHYLHSSQDAAPYNPGGEAIIDDYGAYDPGSKIIFLFPKAGKNNQQLKLKHPITDQELVVGGQGKRLFCTAQVLAHEMYHRYIDKDVKSFPGLTHTDSDGIDDDDERKPGRLNVYGQPIFDDGTGHSIFPPSDLNLPDTYGLSLLFPKFTNYATYGDNEVRARIMERTNILETHPEKDWSTDTENPNSNWRKDDPII